MSLPWLIQRIATDTIIAMVTIVINRHLITVCRSGVRLTLLIIALSISTAWAQRGAPPTDSLTIDEAIAIAEQRHGGKVVNAQPIDSDGRSGYQIRILQRDGKVVTVLVNDSDKPAK